MMTISQLKTALREAMEQVYGEMGTMWEWTPAQIAEIKALAQFYRSDAWLFPEKFQADLCLEKRFGWGEIQAQLQLQSQRICACRLYTDAMDAAAITELEALLHDCPLTSQAADRWHGRIRGIRHIAHQIQITVELLGQLLAGQRTLTRS